MRETFVALLVMVGIAGTYYTAKHFQHNESGSKASSKLFTQSASSRKKLLKFKKSQSLQQGELNESASHRGSQQVESDGESFGSEEGASNSLEQTQKLPSIYQDEEAEQPRPAVSLEEELESESNGNKISSQTSPAKQPVVYGIPVASWLKQQKNRLAAKVDLTNPTGMRLFFNCMEIKKQGTEPLSQRQCKELAVSREKSRGAALIQ